MSSNETSTVNKSRVLILLFSRLGIGLILIDSVWLRNVRVRFLDSVYLNFWEKYLKIIDHLVCLYNVRRLHHHGEITGLRTRRKSASTPEKLNPHWKGNKKVFLKRSRRYNLEWEFSLRPNNRKQNCAVVHEGPCEIRWSAVQNESSVLPESVQRDNQVFYRRMRWDWTTRREQRTLGGRPTFFRHCGRWLNGKPIVWWIHCSWCTCSVAKVQDVLIRQDFLVFSTFYY